MPVLAIMQAAVVDLPCSHLGWRRFYRGELGWMPVMTLVERNMQLRESCTLEQAVGKLNLWEAIRSFKLTVCKHSPEMTV